MKVQPGHSLFANAPGAFEFFSDNLIWRESVYNSLPWQRTLLGEIRSQSPSARIASPSNLYPARPGLPLLITLRFDVFILLILSPSNLGLLSKCSHLERF